MTQINVGAVFTCKFSFYVKNLAVLVAEKEVIFAFGNALNMEEVDWKITEACESNGVQF